MIRRFVNLVAQDYNTGARSLHRLDVAKHLFYPSTARAEAASTKKEKESNNGGNKLPRIGSRLLRQLPPPTMCLQPFPAAYHGLPPQETFALLGGPHGSDGRILHAGKGGQVLLYDADAGSTATLPDLAFAQPKGLYPIFIFISIADAGAGKDKESLYVITDRYEWRHQCHNFEVLDLSQLPHRWEHLPPPPFITRSTSTCPGVKSFAVLDGGRTICMSMLAKKQRTYCFDTRSREWWHAGDWTLPFHGRAEYVPELHSWLGSSCFDDLCSSSDLSVVSAMDARGAGAAAPKLQHVWQDINPTDEEESIELKGRLRGIVLRRIMQWVLTGRDLINLGGGRFCIAKFFRVQRVVRHGREEDDIETEAEFVELSGVEVVRGGSGDDGGELRMVKHKSKRYMFTTDEIKCVL